LPGRAWRDHDFLNAHVGETLTEIVVIDAVPTAQEIPWTLVEWKGFDDLLRGPLRRRVLGGIKVDHPALIMA
jgi:hypothetical protein